MKVVVTVLLLLAAAANSYAEWHSSWDDDSIWHSAALLNDLISAGNERATWVSWHVSALPPVASVWHATSALEDVDAQLRALLRKIEPAAPEFHFADITQQNPPSSANQYKHLTYHAAMTRLGHTEYPTADIPPGGTYWVGDYDSGFTLVTNTTDDVVIGITRPHYDFPSYSQLWPSRTPFEQRRQLLEIMTHIQGPWNWRLPSNVVDNTQHITYQAGIGTDIAVVTQNDAPTSGEHWWQDVDGKGYNEGYYDRYSSTVRQNYPVVTRQWEHPPLTPPFATNILSATFYGVAQVLTAGTLFSYIVEGTWPPQTVSWRGYFSAPPGGGTRVAVQHLSGTDAFIREIADDAFDSTFRLFGGVVGGAFRTDSGVLRPADLIEIPETDGWPESGPSSGTWVMYDWLDTLIAWRDYRKQHVPVYNNRRVVFEPDFTFR